MLLTAITAIFALASLLLIGIILIQEPKGGGLSEAFGGMGGETFGHKAGGANKLTWALAAIWIAAALSHHLVASKDTGSFGSMKENPKIEAPQIPGGLGDPGPATQPK